MSSNARWSLWLTGLILALCLFSLGQTWRICIRVVDGDTIVLNGNETIRLIGVDTPETKDPRKPVEAFGQEAAEFTRTLVEGKKVRLDYDQERFDKYGRTLAYVFLEDGTFVNAQLVLQGYGHAYTSFPFKYLEEFRNYERTAREKGVGLWGPGGAGNSNQRTDFSPAEKAISNGDMIVYIMRDGSKYHVAGCTYLTSSTIPISLKEAVANGYTRCSVCNPPRLKKLGG